MPFMQYIKWGGIVLLVIAVLSAWFHYNSVVSERDLLAQNNAVLQEAFDREKAATVKLQSLLDKAYDKFDKLTDTMQDMANNQRDSRKELEALNGKFRKHDLEELAKKKPGLIEKRLNNGTRDTFRVLEQSTEFETDGSSSE
jgi:predicted patatin/cPLA2 family phospholipase